MKLKLVAIGEPSHAAHYAEDVVVRGVDTDFTRVRARDSVVREDKLERGVVDAREVARARWLVFFRAEGKRVHVDTSVRVARVVLEWLNKVEVRTFAFRESVLSVELEFGRDDRVFSPAVHVEGGFG